MDSVEGLEDGEGFMRVMDVTDPTNIVQVGAFVTEGVLPPVNAQLSGTRDAHNVVLHGDNGLAYWAGYYEGIRVVDFALCEAGQGFEACTPMISEVAHYGGGTNPPANFWGVRARPPGWQHLQPGQRSRRRVRRQRRPLDFRASRLC